MWWWIQIYSLCASNINVNKCQVNSEYEYLNTKCYKIMNPAFCDPQSYTGLLPVFNRWLLMGQCREILEINANNVHPISWTQWVPFIRTPVFTHQHTHSQQQFSLSQVLFRFEIACEFIGSNAYDSRLL